jgi:hypothetical protein
MRSRATRADPAKARRPARALGLGATIAAAAAAAVAAATLFAPAPARAAEGCPIPAMAGPALAGVEPTRRLAWIEARLTRTEQRAQRWAFRWGAGIAGSGIASLLPAPFVAPENRVDWYTAAAASGIGVAAFVVAPPIVLRDAPALRTEIARSTRADVCSLLAVAETDLVRVARDEAGRGRWYAHLGNVLFNVGVGLFLGLGFHHWTAGAVNAVAGTAVGEAVIFTRPTGTIHELDAYLAGSLS